MAYNFNNQVGFNSSSPAPMPFQQQNVQPLFPQPQGNVYNINSTLEVANVPTGAGISVALCLNEGFMYIKTMQNGNPIFWAYKISPYDNTNSAETNSKIEDKQIDKYEQRFLEIEKQVNELKNSFLKNKGGDWQL